MLANSKLALIFSTGLVFHAQGARLVLDVSNRFQ
jgi:hypothetical protein